MSRRKVQKFFSMTGRFDITIRIPADNKQEAVAWANEYMSSIITLDLNNYQNIDQDLRPTLQMVATKKIKRPSRVKLLKVEEPLGE
jgi:hypothetical protein